MTVDTTGSGGIAPYDPNDMTDLGFEDVTASDMTMPRITIQHKDGLFKNNLSGETFPTLRVVLLGVIKQRVMWAKDVATEDKPLCKSPNFEHGFPNISDEIPKDKRFPWDKSNFEPTQLQVVDLEPSKNHPQGWSSNGHSVLPCNSCIFKEWEKGDWKQPPCAEQHTYPLMYQTEEGNLMPALVSFQKTGIKPSKTYINAFAQAKSPMFTQYTDLSLNQFSRGTVDYCVPVFKKAGETPREMWPEFAEQYRNVRVFVRMAPRGDEDYVPAESDNVNTPPTQAQPAPVPAVQGTTSTAPASPAPSSRRPTAPATPASSGSAPTEPASIPESDEDLPF